MLTIVNKDCPPNSVGARIIEARHSKSMTQLDVSSRLGVSRAAVAQWEINTTSPSIAKLEEVALVLGVQPEWLAYGVRVGETKIVYRNPTSENICWLNEVSFTDSPEEFVEGTPWGIPKEHLTYKLDADPANTILCAINSNAVEPDYEMGDTVFVDKSDRRPSPAGVFLYWDGIGMSFARMQAVPAADPKMRITQKGADAIEMSPEDVQIIGRVKGRIRRG